MGQSEKITDAEWAVMSVLWQRHPLPATEVVEALWAKKAWSLTTVRTLLARLVKKGAVKARREGRRYLYEPKVSMECCLQHASRSLMDRLVGFAPSTMVIQMVKEADLSDQEIKELRKVLREKER